MVEFKGLGVALVTPFTEKGDVDWVALEKLIEMQIENGVDFLVPCGTTGECPTLKPHEHVEIISRAVNVSQGRVTVLAGTGANCTREAIFLTEGAKRVGADGALVVSPYYNKPMETGFLDYYRKVAEVGLPVVLYDIPGRTAKGVPTKTILKLARERVIIGVKWASGDHGQLMDLIHMSPEDFTVLSGDDALTFNLMSLGGDGVISVVSNIIPDKMADFVKHVSKKTGAGELGRDLHYKLLPLMRAMLRETNPIPVKTALGLMYPDIFEGQLRSPLLKMSDENKGWLKNVLRQYDLIASTP